MMASISQDIFFNSRGDLIQGNGCSERFTEQMGAFVKYTYVPNLSSQT